MNPLKFSLWLAAAIMILVGIMTAPVILLKPSHSIIAATLPTIVLCIVLISLFFVSTKKKEIVDAGVVYNDRYVEIYEDRIVINGYYLGPFGTIVLAYDEILDMKILRLKYGNWKRQGTNDFKIWFALDTKRGNNMNIFVLECSRFQCKVGFSVEDFDAVSAVFKDRGLLTEK